MGSLVVLAVGPTIAQLKAQAFTQKMFTALLDGTLNYYRSAF